ncbi:hypothetical protein BDK51DRAFT_24173 [Blyttiomyces helicus]|uniref:P-loop containing nucleoside triphosphate hydrolase protein n=1 Tax=Blyttiomyces helicus TaxID=388810 RepID=A0A4P9WBJ6_9FUNG|nr:hypothetical protein BDK51DRAFT_24173 [Blyttiomyces helicus]|eukprot:RKO88975.1 hypothetical protein BDK51DRAFT_24173 [Blyttiomyces helicus]
MEAVGTLASKFSGPAVRADRQDVATPSTATALTDPLFGKATHKHFPQLHHGLLGQSALTGEPVYLNTDAPFCLVAVGVQGAGKSHSVSTVIENCMLDVPRITHADKPCATLVFHYDTDQANYCQAATLTSPNESARIPPPVPVVERLIILVSPSFYYQRKRFYGNWPNCEVRPLLFRWREMTAGTIKSLMRVPIDKDPPLYMGSVLGLLRRLQKEDSFPTLASFKEQLETLDFSTTQSAPLQQRLSLIESLLAESSENAALPERIDLADACAPGTVVICDLTDPMLSAPESRGIFEVVLERFRTLSLKCGKLVVLDEAHKFLTHSTSSDELGSTIVELVRQMRHHGMRVVVSSQSPMTIPDELLELASVCLVHKFHSKDWFRRLQAKIPLDDAAFEAIMELPTGNAIVFATRWRDFGEDVEGLGRGVRQIRVRERITADGGTSKVTSGSK